MDIYTRKSRLAIAVLISFGLSGCNIDVKVDDTLLDETSKTKTGVISQIDDSVVVNGTRYTIDDAEVIIEGLQSDATALKPGMFVSVTGIEKSDGSGVATLVQYEDDVEGIVNSNNISDSGSGFLNVMGQTVRVDSNTRLESYDVSDVNIADIDIGNIVEVSGYASGDGDILATWIEVKNSQYDSGREMELKGYISNLTATHFNIGNLQVNFENAALDSDFMNEIKNGQYIEVKSYQGLDINGVLVASEIDLKGDGEKEIKYDDNDESVEIQGLITKVLNENELEINGTTVLLANNISLLQNLSIANLRVDDIVEVEGYMDSSGKFVATELEVKRHDNTSQSGSGDNSNNSDNDDSSSNSNDRDSSNDSDNDDSGSSNDDSDSSNDSDNDDSGSSNDDSDSSNDSDNDDSSSSNDDSDSSNDSDNDDSSSSNDDRDSSNDSDNDDSGSSNDDSDSSNDSDNDDSSSSNDDRDSSNDSDNDDSGSSSNDRDSSNDSDNDDSSSSNDDRDSSNDSDNDDSGTSNDDRDSSNDSDNDDSGSSSNDRDSSNDSDNDDSGSSSNDRDSSNDSDNDDSSSNSNDRDSSNDSDNDDSGSNSNDRDSSNDSDNDNSSSRNDDRDSSNDSENDSNDRDD